MSEKHDALFKLDDLKDLGFGDDDNTPEPDTGITIATIVEDQKTPGNTKSFLALLGYQRGTRKQLRDFKHAISIRLAYAFGFFAAMLIAWEMYKTFALHK